MTNGDTVPARAGVGPASARRLALSLKPAARANSEVTAVTPPARISDAT